MALEMVLFFFFLLCPPNLPQSQLSGGRYSLYLYSWKKSLVTILQATEGSKWQLRLSLTLNLCGGGPRLQNQIAIVAKNPKNQESLG